MLAFVVIAVKLLAQSSSKKILFNEINVNARNAMGFFMLAGHQDVTIMQKAAKHTMKNYVLDAQRQWLTTPEQL
ncbi:hypothetical protein LG58_2594 [Kosakonia radicincitans YD4]|nr:hypothetical protein LG58_2594 [Kosakonia radicincitans YD4]